eukprot:Opistho-1_new@55360
MCVAMAHSAEIHFYIRKSSIEGVKDGTFSVRIKPGWRPEEIKKAFRKAAGIEDSSLSFKLRNSGGSVVPFSPYIAANDSQTRYLLEITAPYDSVKPVPKDVNQEKLEAELRAMCSEFEKRVLDAERLANEEYLQQLEKDALNDIAAMRNQLTILTRKIAESEEMEWVGTFKKNPLW